MRFRITVRGEEVELRGYVDAETQNQIERLFADDLEDSAVLVASPADPGWNPFAATMDTSLELILAILAQQEYPNLPDLIRAMAEIHFMQANVIQGERALREEAEAELQDRELHHFETEQELERMKAVQDQYTRDMVKRVDDAEGEVDEIRDRATEIADALSDNWESGDLAGAVNEAIEFLRGLGVKQ